MGVPPYSHETLGVPHLPVGIDDLLIRSKPLPASEANGTTQRHPGAETKVECTELSTLHNNPSSKIKEGDGHVLSQ